MRSAGMCSEVGCGAVVLCKTLCRSHYMRAYYSRRMTGRSNLRNQGLVCSVSGCLRDAKAKGLCGLHYQRQRLGIPLDISFGFSTLSPYAPDFSAAPVKLTDLQIGQRYRSLCLKTGPADDFVSFEVFKAFWEMLQVAFDGRCAYCGGVGVLSVDHIVPISKNGTNKLSNLAPVCFPCNTRKRDHDLTDVVPADRACHVLAMCAFLQRLSLKSREAPTIVRRYG